MTIPDLTDLFCKMARSNQPAKYKGFPLKHGTFKERTSHYLTLKKNGKYIGNTLITTLQAYMDCMGIETTPSERREMLKIGFRVVMAYQARVR